MVTKVFSKSSRVKLFYYVLAGILFASLHTTAIAWLRSQNSLQALSQDYVAKRFMHISDLTKREWTKNLSPGNITSEQSFETFVIDEVLKVCSEDYPEIDPNYVLALIYHESRFIPDVVNSKTGATGLMQILPKWHTARAEKLGVSLTDPAGNILTGCDILNEVYQQSGSMSYALNVYAGGYTYANNYKNTKSPFERELDEILVSGVLYSIGR